VAALAVSAGSRYTVVLDKARDVCECKSLITARYNGQRWKTTRQATVDRSFVSINPWVHQEFLQRVRVIFRLGLKAG